MMNNTFIGIRTYNQENFIDGCLSSVMEQDCPNMRVVIFDDKSTDKTIQKLKQWKKDFERKGISFEIYQNDENGGCGQSFERLGRIVASQIKDNDVFVMLDSDDKFTSPKAVSRCVKQLENTGSNVCIAGFDLSGDMDLVLNWNSGTPHNNLSKKLAMVGSATVEEMPEIASHADSIGWTKIVRGDIFKKYMNMYPNVSKEMRVCEDFPSLAMLLYKDTKVTGLPENMYDYYKHKQSSTVQAVPDDFRVIRLGFLKSLQKMVADNKDQFIDGAERYVNKFLEVKYMVIGNIVDKKSNSGDLKGYTKQDWENDFQTAIDCKDLRIENKQDKTSDMSSAVLSKINSAKQK